MRGDFSRTTHRPNRHYSRVLLQQGRVLLDADWNEQSAIQLQTMRTMMRDLVGQHGGPSDALAFKVDVAESEDNKLVLAVGNGLSENMQEGELSRNLPVGRYYVDGVLVEHDVSKLDGEAMTVETEFELRKDRVFVYLEVWEQHVTWIEENKRFKDRSMREIALGGPDTCSRAQVRWSIETELVQLGRNEREDGFDENEWVQRRLRQLSRHRIAMAASLTTADIGAGDPCRDTAQPRYRGAENRLYRVEIHAINDDVPTFKWSRENGSVVFPIAVDEGITSFEDGRLTLALGIGTDPRFGLVRGNIVELVTQALDADGKAGPLFEVAHIDDAGRNVTLSPLDKRPAEERRVDLPINEWALLRRWDQALDSKRSNGGAATMRDGAIVIDGPDEFVLEDGIVVRFLLPKQKPDEKPAEPPPPTSEDGQPVAVPAVDPQGFAIALARGVPVNREAAAAPKVEPLDVAPCRVGDYWLIPARTIPGDVEWPKLDSSKEAFELPHGVVRRFAPLAMIRPFDGQLSVSDLRRRFNGLAF